MRKLIARFRHETKAATAIEYGVLATLLAGGIIASASTLGTGLNTMFGEVGECTMRFGAVTEACK